MSVHVKEFLIELSKCNLNEMRTFRKMVSDQAINEASTQFVRSKFLKLLTIIDLVGVLQYHENWAEEPPLSRKEVIEGGIRFN